MCKMEGQQPEILKIEFSYAKKRFLFCFVFSIVFKSFSLPFKKIFYFRLKRWLSGLEQLLLFQRTRVWL